VRRAHSGAPVASEHHDDAHALAVGHAVLALLATLGISSGTAFQVYDQRDGHRPPDAKSADSYRRRHRALRKAGTPGVYVRGKLLLATLEGWATELPKPRKLSLVQPPPTIDDDLDRELGIVAHGAGRRSR
jgi:hypothetical protein